MPRPQNSRTSPPNAATPQLPSKDNTPHHSKQQHAANLHPTPCNPPQTSRTPNTLSPAKKPTKHTPPTRTPKATNQQHPWTPTHTPSKASLNDQTRLSPS
ncbi:hypothetical protein U1Q18_048251, partial [Sarracenia purpurea var. burkii]